MLFFGPRAPCTHCGQRVRKPQDPTKYLCPHCGHPGPWASPEQTRAWEAARDARLRYADLLKQLVTGGSTTALAPLLKETAPLTWYTQAELQQIAVQEINQFVQTALADNVLSEEEDNRLGELVPVLTSWESLVAAYPDLADRLVIANANAGRLPTVSNSNFLLTDREVLHAQCPASLMKEVTLREFRAGYQGFSFPIGKSGIRYRVGGARGHSVVVGTEWQVADTGTLAITSHRAMFVGVRKTIEMQYAKLANLNVYTDGIQFHLTNRQTAPLFTVRNGEVLAALINAAVQRTDEDPKRGKAG